MSNLNGGWNDVDCFAPRYVFCERYLCPGFEKGKECSGKGKCVEGVCKCRAGYTSNDCGKPLGKYCK